MRDPDLEIMIVAAEVKGTTTIVECRNVGPPLRPDDVLNAVYKINYIRDSEGYLPHCPRYGVTPVIYIVKKIIQYGREWNEIPSGYSCLIELEGRKTTSLQDGDVLGRVESQLRETV